MNNLIIGYGEIGKAVGAVIGEHAVIDLGMLKPEPMEVDIMHICFPYSEEFVEQVLVYIATYTPKHTVIYSTVPITTTRQLHRTDYSVVHSPVEGKHPDLEMSIRLMERWIGYNDKEEGQFFANYFRDLGLKVKLVENTDCTEALKLLSTTEYGINIEFARYKKEVADAIGMDYQLTKNWNENYNRLYKDLGMEKRYQKYVLDAPDGPKGGHCITPNAKILNKQYPNVLVDIVGETYAL